MPDLYEVRTCGCDVARIAQLCDMPEIKPGNTAIDPVIALVVENMREVAPDLAQKLGEAGIRAISDTECRIGTIQVTRLEKSFLQIVHRQYKLSAPILPK